MTFHSFLTWTGGAFLVAATIISYHRGDVAVITATASAAAIVVGYRLAEAFYKGGSVT